MLPDEGRRCAQRLAHSANDGPWPPVHAQGHVCYIGYVLSVLAHLSLLVAWFAFVVLLVTVVC